MNTITAARPSGLQNLDPIWKAVREEAGAAVARDPLLSAFLYSSVINQDSLEDAVIHRLAERLDHQDVGADLIRQTFDAMRGANPDWSATVRVDIQA
jgi:serine O-acetyltransferase